MICGNKFKTLDKLTKHFTSVHEREMKKRKNRSQNKGGKGRRQAATYFADEAKLSRWDRRLGNGPNQNFYDSEAIVQLLVRKMCDADTTTCTTAC